ncbi:MAG: hypothetical protein PHQ12_11285 [Chthoniobacteraceae bacterium]|nr:hypothetical protein [Chthoniobacteraceae bacterium]
MTGILRAFTEQFSTRWRANTPGYFRAFAPYLAVAFFAAAADFWSTYATMLSLGVESELHPAIRLVSHVFGAFLGPLLGKVVQYAALVAVTILWRPYARIIFLPVIVLYLYAAWFNLWGNELYTPLFAKLLLRFTGQ